MNQAIAGGLVLVLAFGPSTAGAQAVITTPRTPMELPVEPEIELAPAASLKKAPLWKELIQLLRNPDALDCTANPDFPNTCRTTAPFQRRPGFGVAMPPLDVWNPGYNFLTSQRLRLRTSDGEVSWDQPGPLFDPDEAVATDEFNVPTELRRIVGYLVDCALGPGTQGFGQGAGRACGVQTAPAGSLVVSRKAPGTSNVELPGSAVLPPHGTVVAVRAVDQAGNLQELDGTSTTQTVDVEELEIPVNEEDFFRPSTDILGPPATVPAALRSHLGRTGAEVLGKALFWDMQVGSDGVQSCGSCHFHAGIDNRTRNQLNPGSLGGDVTFQVKQPNQSVVASDFPFRRLQSPELAGEGDPAQVVETNRNDVMSSMGVSRFTLFVDIPPIGGLDVAGTPLVEGSFGPASAVGGVRPLARDVGTVAADPIPAMDGFRRVEPRNTPTMHGAAFNLDNFWDGRARFNFNGGSVFGPSDPTAHVFIDPGAAGAGGGALVGTTNGHVRAELDPEVAEQPVRIKFSSLGSQAVGPPLSDFEMSFSGRNWAKIGKKMLQGTGSAASPFVTPLANQLVATTDSRLGPFSNQGGSLCGALPTAWRSSTTATAVNKPGLCINYVGLVQLAFARQYWHNADQHLNGCFTDDGDSLTPPPPAPTCAPGTPHDPFDGYVLTLAPGAAAPADTSQFRQSEANFSLFFALSIQAYEELLIPDDTPLDRFMDANPLAANGVGQPGEQAVLFPTLIRQLVTGSPTGSVVLVPDDPSTAEYDGFGPDELFGFDVFAGGNLTAALAPSQAVDPISGVNRNPIAAGTNPPVRLGSNPFTRNSRCMLCHLGPEQTDHSINIAHGLLKGDAEFEFPTPPSTGVTYVGPGGNTAGVNIPSGADTTILVPSPEPPGPLAVVPGLILAEEIEETPQDAVEVEPRGFALLDDPATPWDDRIVAQPAFFAFGDQGVYNVALRPNLEDAGRGGDDAFGWPLSLSALTLLNIAGNGGAPCEQGGPCFQPCDGPLDSCVMTTVSGDDLGATFEETGGGLFYPASTHTLQSVNPGFDRSPIVPLLPEYMVPWVNGLPAGELHPQIDEMAGLAPNTLTPPNGGPAIEFPEVLFGADVHCGVYDPAAFGAGAPNFGWGPSCPNNQSGVSGNFLFPVHGTWPVPNRVLREGAFKAPPLRNVEMTGPYFHTGSYLTLRQVVDFYLRGGDFPVTNRDARDPHILDVSEQAFGFGRTAGPGLGLIDTFVNGFQLVGNIADALPDTVYLYDRMPDTNHPLTPEPATTTDEQAKNALVRLLLAMTDRRVKYERAPFDRPEIFVPIDGTAPENTGGRAQLLSLSGVQCTPASTGVCFRRVPAVGTAGRLACGAPGAPPAPDCGPLANFLGVSSTPVGSNVDCASSGGASCDHFDIR